jgi:hypothetical protein
LWKRYEEAARRRLPVGPYGRELDYHLAHDEQFRATHEEAVETWVWLGDSVLQRWEVFAKQAQIRAMDAAHNGRTSLSVDTSSRELFLVFLAGEKARALKLEEILRARSGVGVT